MVFKAEACTCEVLALMLENDGAIQDAVFNLCEMIRELLETSRR